jgi:hypothetical protein
MPPQFTTVGFDLDPASLTSLRDALPGWHIDNIVGATIPSLARNGHAAAADLLVVGARANGTDTLALCRFLASCTSFATDSREAVSRVVGERGGLQCLARRLDAPLLVLLPPGHESLVSLVLETGAHSCLLLPICAKEVASMWAHAQAGNQPGRHTLNLEGAQDQDRWRDEGGEG